MTYMKLTKCEVGLLINFNVVKLKDGIRRLSLVGRDYEEKSFSPTSTL